MSVVRGRPPGLAGGIRGASRAYCSSLSACPAPKSPTKARFSAVHMACLQEGLLPFPKPPAQPLRLVICLDRAGFSNGLSDRLCHREARKVEMKLGVALPLIDVAVGSNP